MPHAALKLFTVEHNTATATCAHDSDVSTGSGNGPYIVAAGMFFTEANLHTHNHWDSLHHGYEPLRMSDLLR